MSNGGWSVDVCPEESCIKKALLTEMEDKEKLLVEPEFSYSHWKIDDTNLIAYSTNALSIVQERHVQTSNYSSKRILSPGPKYAPQPAFDLDGYTKLNIIDIITPLSEFGLADLKVNFNDGLIEAKWKKRCPKPRKILLSYCFTKSDCRQAHEGNYIYSWGATASPFNTATGWGIQIVKAKISPAHMTSSLKVVVYNDGQVYSVSTPEKGTQEFQKLSQLYTSLQAISLLPVVDNI